MAKAMPETNITRRAALSGGMACALALVVPRRWFGSLFSPGTSPVMTGGRVSASMTPNIYAFRGAGPNTTVIAVTLPDRVSNAERDLGRQFKVRIHAGPKMWEFDVSTQALPTLQRIDDVSVFAGNVVSPLGVDKGLVKALVMELSDRAIGRDGSAGIWAEHDRMGSRRRIGTPFLSKLVAENEGLAAIYHSSTPAEDRDLLMKPLATAIADRLRGKDTAADVVSRGRRLASALLPDILRYDSDLPTGFTFAAQNGRHPSESTDEMVTAFLNGSAPSKISVRLTRHTIESFPYFRLPATTV
jgi:hypothetical protein